MKYDPTPKEPITSTQSATLTVEVERYFLQSAIAIYLLFLLLDVLSVNSAIDHKGVLIGLLACVCNLRLWKIIVRRLLARSIPAEDLSAEQKEQPSSPSAVPMVILKMVLLTVFFALLCTWASDLILSVLVGIVSYIIGGSLLIFVVSYNKG